LSYSGIDEIPISHREEETFIGKKKHSLGRRNIHREEETFIGKKKHSSGRGNVHREEETR
jgi:hypothetical protein